ncbi:MAG: glycosyl hydrolase [Bacteroidetes bacterium]|nr:MAG: glycosyl hydrolase [Bacteroidota bacterium]
MKSLLSALSKALLVLAVLMLVIAPGDAFAQKKKKSDEKNDTITSGQVSGLKWRGIGPAFTSGRIADFAVNPCNPSEYYVAVASGHIWKTVNNGTTFSPIFDNYGAYSIGCLALDPNNHHVIWAGTGENNHQRALGYGNGVYKSIDGGKKWKNMGLKESRQIGKILIDPRNSDVVYVAAEGSVWGPGGERGLYKTVDGGTTWELVLEISEHTGINDIVMDPRNPDVIYAASEQRRRHVHTKIGGGPESGIHKTNDGGKTWKKLKSGLPGGDVGGIGLAISPVNPDVVYAIIEASGESGGFFRTGDRGASWKKMGSHHASGQYYNEIYCDPRDVDKVYSVETVSKVTLDGGKTWKSIGNNSRHVDDHAMWINPKNTEHFIIGGDGGVYETYDAGKNYIFKSNLPLTQFYRVNVDNTWPFYWVYGGTQDNSSFGGPSQNTSRQGVSAGEWVVTLGGDGFWQAIDPENPDIVYSEYQYGNITRYDKKSGQGTGIKPQPSKGEDTYKWNWNTPFIISPHNGTRLYMAANKVFKSDNRGDKWEVISDDITAQVDRNTWPVMDRYWGVDAVQKDVSTSLFGMAVSLAESKVKEDLLYVGTDDGVISVTEDAGGDWQQVKTFPGVPEYTYVSDILPDKYDENVVYASFDNHKRDDFKPYILKSTDKGRTWTSISSNLPENGTVHTIEQDNVVPELLFVGTEFGAFFSIDGGKIWTQLKSGLPSVAVKDMVIQERETDLVLATFGRGFYILDDYSPLRVLNKELYDSSAYIFPINDALMYTMTRGRYGQGSTPYYGKNPDFGAVFTYYVKESPKTLKQMRKEEEGKLVKDKKPIPIPGMEELRAEENEVKPYLIFTITDQEGNIVRKINKSISKGLKRMAWNMTYPSMGNIRLRDDKYSPTNNDRDGMAIMPGTYYVSLAQWVRGEITELVEPVEFSTVVLDNVTLPAPDRAELVAFLQKTTKLVRAIQASQQLMGHLKERVQYLKQAINNTPDATPELLAKATEMEQQLDDIRWAFSGQSPKASREENWPAPPSINERVGALVWSHWGSTSRVSETQMQMYDILAEDFPPLLEQLKNLAEVKIPALEAELNALGAPWTPGRIPTWNE